MHPRSHTHTHIYEYWYGVFSDHSRFASISNFHLTSEGIPIYKDIKNNAWVTVNNDFWVTSEAIIFTSNKVMSENDWQIASRVTQKVLITVTNVLFYFLHAILCPEHTLSIADIAIVTKDGLFWLSIVTSPQLICDVTRTWGTGIVRSYSSIVLAGANWHKGDLY